MRWTSWRRCYLHAPLFEPLLPFELLADWAFPFSRGFPGIVRERNLAKQSVDICCFYTHFTSAAWIYASLESEKYQAATPRLMTRKYMCIYASFYSGTHIYSSLFRLHPDSIPLVSGPLKRNRRVILFPAPLARYASVQKEFTCYFDVNLSSPYGANMGQTIHRHWLVRLWSILWSKLV
jgi:hypothetical protein